MAAAPGADEDQKRRSAVPTRQPELRVSPDLAAAERLSDHFRTVRNRTEALAAPVSAEDAQVQSMPDVSPTKWHLAHTSWFFETFVLRDFDPGYDPADPRFAYLFNSYYDGEGDRQPRPDRGLITRPTLDEVRAYRARVTDRLSALLDAAETRDHWPQLAALVELGCHHEEQHQELILTDIKHVLAQNPFAPAYAAPYPKRVASAPDHRFVAFDGGAVEIGHDPDAPGFHYDNEGPRHTQMLTPFALGSRPITNGEYLAFIEDGGYRTPGPWLSDGWATVCAEGWRHPLYWRETGDGWQQFTLRGLQPINWDEPVCHLSFYEADAYASWAGARLPWEAELEVATAAARHDDANDLGSGRLHPAVAEDHGTGGSSGHGLAQLAGDVWEWTRSAYSPYPRFAPHAGTVGEYNGKFMCNQYVLRGGSCATPPGHWRPTYRNFFPAGARWQFSGLRLAKDL
nr:ergothioneine biosynthesis protein EgtB [Rhodothalassium salexigens]